MEECDGGVASELSSETLQALLEFERKQGAMNLSHVTDLLLPEEEEAEVAEMPSEDWQLSQFWYTEKTAEVLATEASSVGTRIACVSCPTLYTALLPVKPETCEVVLFEYDTRFNKFGKNFVFYDYNEPLRVDAVHHHNYDLVVADPPFLSDECLRKTSETIKLLTNDNILLLTGAVMEESAKNLLGLTRCNFRPLHTNNLANDFLCYTNYTSTHLNQ